MGIAFFDEQRRKGAVGEAAVRFEILCIVLIVLSFLSYFTNGYGIFYGVVSLFIPGLGFYAAYHSHERYLRIFVILQAIMLALAVIFLIIVIVAEAVLIAALNTTYGGSDENIAAVKSAYITVIVIAVIFYLLDMCLLVLSIVWAQRLRALLKLLPHAENGFPPQSQGYAPQPTYIQQQPTYDPAYTQPNYGQQPTYPTQQQQPTYTQEPSYTAQPSTYSPQQPENHQQQLL